MSPAFARHYGNEQSLSELIGLHQRNILMNITESELPAACAYLQSRFAAHSFINATENMINNSIMRRYFYLYLGVVYANYSGSTHV